MRRTVVLASFIALAAMAAQARADVATFEVAGTCPEFQSVGFEVMVDFTPTGGDFNAGTGTATAKFTLENTSGLYPYQVPALGNPVLTGFYFNVPPGTGVNYTGAATLSGSVLVSSGANINGTYVPPGCTELVTDMDVTTWYQLLAGGSTGQFGIFTNAVSTEEGIKGGLVDPEVIPDCGGALGDVFTPLVVAGRVCFEVQLTDLNVDLDSAEDFASICSIVPGDQQMSSVAGKMQGTGTDGEESCFLGRPCPVPVQSMTWSTIKGLNR